MNKSKMFSTKEKREFITDAIKNMERPDVIKICVVMQDMNGDITCGYQNMGVKDMIVAAGMINLDAQCAANS